MPHVLGAARAAFVAVAARTEQRGGLASPPFRCLEERKRRDERGFCIVLVGASLERLTRDARANAMLIEQLKAIALATEAAEKQ